MVTNSLEFKMFVPFKGFIFHGRKPNGSDRVLTFRLLLVSSASCFHSYANLFNVLRTQFLIVPKYLVQYFKFYANCFTTDVNMDFLY